MFANWVLAAAAILGADPAPKGTAPVWGRVSFHDGSTLRCQLLDPDVEIATAYGPLRVPVRDLKGIAFGLHYPNGVEEQVASLVKTLGSTQFKDRLAAKETLLSLGRFAYPAVKGAPKPADLEITRLMESVAEALEGSLPEDKRRLDLRDRVEATEFVLAGKLTSRQLRVRTTHFGESALNLEELAALQVLGNSLKMKVVVDAEKYSGSDQQVWCNTGYRVQANELLTVTATGEIDLWPATPGQHTATPQGREGATNGAAQGLNAGTLVGRIGEQGKVFSLGAKYAARVPAEGLLYVRIVPSLWNNNSTGRYELTLE